MMLPVQTVNVLLVEDNPGDADLMEDYVESAPGLDVRLHRVETLAQALSRLDQGLELDMVVLDLTLPDAEGTETLDRILEHAAHLPIVVLTGLHDRELAWEAIRRGAADYLLKDELTPDLLLRTLRYALDRAADARRLRQSEEWFRSLVENVSDIIVVLDPDGRLRYASPSQQPMLGYEPGTLVGSKIFDLVHPDHLDNARAALGSVLRGGEPVVFQFPVRTVDGEWRMLAGDARNLEELPAVRGIVVTARDVTEAVAREAQLERQKAELTERIKEQRTLYRVLTMLHAAAPGPEAAFAEVVAAMPDGFQHPERTAARLRIGEQSWVGDGFDETPWALVAPIGGSQGLEPIGSLSVCRTILADHEDAPFLREEEELLRVVAEAIADALELARTEAALRRSEAYFRSIAEHSSDVLAVLDRDLNRRYMTLAGVKVGESDDRTQSLLPDIYDYTNPDDQAAARHMLAELSHVPGGVGRVEVRVRLNEEWRTLELAARNLLDDPAVAGIVVNARDITEHRRTEERYRTLFETMGQGVIYLDTDGQIISTNPAAERILGRSRDEMTATTSFDPGWRTIHPDGSDFPPDEHPVAVAARTGREVEGVVMGVWNPDEERARWIRVDARPQFRPGEDTPYQLYTTFNDITEQVENEEALLRKDRILEAVSVAAEGFLVAGAPADAMHNVLQALGTATGVSVADVWALAPPSQAASDAPDELRYQWTAAGHVAPTYPHPLPPDLSWRRSLRQRRPVHGRRDTLPLPAQRSIEELGIRSVVLLPIIVGEELWGCLRLVDSFDDRLWSTAELDALRAAAAILGAAIQRRRDEETLRERDQQLLQAQKMEAIGRLAGGIAHDFNNLLTAVSGYVEFVDEEVDDPEITVQLGEIRRAADRGAGLTRQLLAFSRKTLIEERVIDPGAVIRALEPMLARLIGERIALRESVADDRVAVYMDPSQLEQVIMNLVLNARDAVSDDGHIWLEVDAVAMDRDAPPMLPDRPEPGQYARLCVRDDGSGMDTATQGRLFEPFFTTKAPGRGTGLGLSTVWGIVQHADGFIDVRSAPGEGTTFTILIPAAEEDLTEVTSAAARPAPTGPVTATVLVVEDEAPVRAVAVRSLRRVGYTVLEAPDGPTALQLAEDHDGPVDLLLSDVVMPGMSGLVLAAALRERFDDVRVILTSGYTHDEIGDLDLEESEIAFLHKPYTPASLAAKVGAVLNG